MSRNVENKAVALYERLSRDDEIQGDSNSIVNQKNYLEEYAKRNNYINYRHYTDDGYSGTSFNRPGFNKMIEDIEKGQIGMVIVKNMSRFGRNYLQVGFYTEIMFPNKGVRFIAINNSIDSDRPMDNDFTPFLNIMNEWYAKDTSNKIKATLVRGEDGADSGDDELEGFFYIKDNVSADDSIYELLQNPKDDNEKYYVSISLELNDYDLFVYEGKTYNEYYNDPALKTYRDEYEDWYYTEYKELDQQKLNELSEYEMAVWEKNNTPDNLFPEVWKGRHSAEEIEEYNKALESERKAFSEYCHWLYSDAYRQALEKKAREIFTELVKYGIENHFLETLQVVTAKGNLTVKQMLDFPIENIKDCKIRIRAILE